LISKVKTISPQTEITFIECDLSSLSSVQEAARAFISQSSRLNVLMCNAGVMALGPGVSKEGYEIQFATNHLGHALLIKLLMPILLDTASQPDSDVRIINLTSSAYKSTPTSGIEFSTLKSNQARLGPIYAPAKWMRYGQSKLANFLYAIELARHHPEITTVSVHPGFIKTELHQHEGFIDRQLVNLMSGGSWINVEEGPFNQAWAATTPKPNLTSGAYYQPVGVRTDPETKQSADKALAEKLWEWSEKELANWS
jgi:NAD(P)-dependent dehydrogenase (short-subunit alcohol dehydrogenase family)